MQPPSDPVEPAGPDARRAPPCTLVIFGAGGDLTKRLLMPALYNLSGTGQLDDALAVLGVDHVEDSDEGWRSALTATMQSFTTDTTAEFHADRIDAATWGWVRERLRYLKGDFSNPTTFEAIAGRVSGNVHAARA